MARLKNSIENSSFRDPSGFVFSKNNVLYRQINKSYQKEYEFLFESGLYELLTNKNLLIRHEEVSSKPFAKEAYKILKPKKIPFISYPYEWCFEQLKDAALVTLEIQRISIENGMTLKDASAFNIQFLGGKPLLIDTLSFERYQKGSYWIAYKQFCEHFLAPLALASYVDVSLLKSLQYHLDGIPLSIASALLPFKTKFKPSLALHIHQHSTFQARYSDKPVKSKRKMSLMQMLALIQSLSNAIKDLEYNDNKTEWGKYYSFTNYSEKANKSKKKIVSSYIDQVSPNVVWDMGANDGTFSRLLSNRKIPVISSDFDYGAVQRNYCEAKNKNAHYILPLNIDITNPSPALGWGNTERYSFLQRTGEVDTVLFLALIHHIAISQNVPLAKIAHLLSTICKNLIIEFVPKNDSKVKTLLSSRKDIFPTYSQSHFETIFKTYFSIVDCKKVHDSTRSIYLMKRR